MYGMIGQIRTRPGMRARLAEILVDGVSGMPGCLSYIVALDPGDPDLLHVTEVWRDQASHAAALGLPSVIEAISRGRPLIAEFAPPTITEPIGGHGLSST